MWDMPRHLSIVNGVGESFTPLNAFDCALLDAGIANYNHIKLSSIIPPSVIIIAGNGKDFMPREGSLLPGVLAEIRGKQDEFLISILALAFNKNHDEPGMIFELTCRDMALEDAKHTATMMVSEGMKNRGWEIEKAYLKSASLTVKKNFGCAIVAAVMLP